MNKGVPFIILVLSLACSGALAADSRTDPTSSQIPKRANETECPKTFYDLSARVEICAKPLMDLLQGRVEKWPRVENDINDLCQSFGWSERCIKDIGRRCTKGLQRTILSTIANSVARARKRECQKPKLAGFLKLTQCIEKNNALIRSVIYNSTNHLSVIDEKMTDLDVKTNNVCCMVYDIEDQIKLTLGRQCPSESKVLISLYRAVLQDVIELICRKPQCNDIFKGYEITKKGKNQQGQGLIAVLLRIVFSLG